MAPTIATFGSLAPSMLIPKTSTLQTHWLDPLVIPKSQSRLMKKPLDLYIIDGINLCLKADFCHCL